MPCSDTSSSTATLEPLATDAQRQGLFDLYAEIFGAGKADRFRRRFDWQYRGSPARRPGLVDNWLLLRNSAVVGHFGIVHVTVRVDGQLVGGCWACDYLVHPGHRRGRGFLSLTEALDRSAELPMGYGMQPVVASIFARRGYLRLAVGGHLARFCRASAAFRLRPATPRGRLPGSAAIGGLVERCRRLLAATFDASRGVEPPPPDEIELTERLDPDVAALWGSVAADYPVAVERSPEHLAWRYREGGADGRFLRWSRDGRLVACAILERLRWRGLSVLQISDTLVPRSQAAELIPRLAAAAIALGRRLGVDAVVTEGHPSDLRASFLAAGLRPPWPGAESAVALPEHVEWSPHLDAADSWLLTGGDSDRSSIYRRLPWERR